MVKDMVLLQPNHMSMVKRTNFSSIRYLGAFIRLVLNHVAAVHFTMIWFFVLHSVVNQIHLIFSLKVSLASTFVYKAFLVNWYGKRQPLQRENYHFKSRF